MSKVCKFIQIEKIKGFDVLALQSVWDVLAIAGCDSPSLHISFIFSSTAEMPTAPIQVDLYLQNLIRFMTFSLQCFGHLRIRGTRCNRREGSYFSQKKSYFSKEIIFLSKEIIFLSKEITFLSKEIIFLSKEIIFLSKEIIFLSKEIQIQISRAVNSF